MTSILPGLSAPPPRRSYQQVAASAVREAREIDRRDAMRRAAVLDRLISGPARTDQLCAAMHGMTTSCKLALLDSMLAEGLIQHPAKGWWTK